MKIVCISDTHGFHRQLVIPPCDVLIHAGDISRGRGRLEELIDFGKWLQEVPAQYKIIVPGNHDFMFEKKLAASRQLLNAHVLIDQPLNLNGVLFYGSPYQPWFFDWAFNLERGKALAAKWSLIPADTHVLITHSPPLYILDRTLSNDTVGCEDLAARVLQLPALKLHVFGHIHESYGSVVKGKTTFVNASVCNRRYEPVNKPFIYEL